MTLKSGRAAFKLNPGDKLTGSEWCSFWDFSTLWNEGGKDREPQNEDSVGIRTGSVMGWDCWSTGRRSKQAALLGGPRRQVLLGKSPKRLSKDERTGTFYSF